jgi:hypothetical protein
MTFDLGWGPHGMDGLQPRGSEVRAPAPLPLPEWALASIPIPLRSPSLPNGVGPVLIVGIDEASHVVLHPGLVVPAEGEEHIAHDAVLS